MYSVGELVGTTSWLGLLVGDSVEEVVVGAAVGWLVGFSDGSRVGSDGHPNEGSEDESTLDGASDGDVSI